MVLRLPRLRPSTPNFITVFSPVFATKFILLPKFACLFLAVFFDGTQLDIFHLNKLRWLCLRWTRQPVSDKWSVTQSRIRVVHYRQWSATNLFDAAPGTYSVNVNCCRLLLRRPSKTTHPTCIAALHRTTQIVQSVQRPTLTSSAT